MNIGKMRFVFHTDSTKNIDYRPAVGDLPFLPLTV
jgi:hypothetical protein